MKRFAGKAVIFLLLFVVMTGLLDYLSMTEAYRDLFAEMTDSVSYIHGNVGADEIKPYIKKRKQMIRRTC